MHLPRNVTTHCRNANFSKCDSVSMCLFGNNIQHIHSIMKEIQYVVLYFSLAFSLC